MSQILPRFFKENNCKLLIKYDGERINNKNTIKLLYNDFKIKNLGKDTDEPYLVLKELFEINESSYYDEIAKLFSVIDNEIINTAKLEFGDKCIISVMMEESDNNLLYTLHLQSEKCTKHTSSLIIKELVKSMYTKLL